MLRKHPHSFANAEKPETEVEWKDKVERRKEILTEEVLQTLAQPKGTLLICYDLLFCVKFLFFKLFCFLLDILFIK